MDYISANYNLILDIVLFYGCCEDTIVGCYINDIQDIDELYFDGSLKQDTYEQYSDLFCKYTMDELIKIITDERNDIKLYVDAVLFWDYYKLLDCVNIDYTPINCIFDLDSILNIGDMVMLVDYYFRCEIYVHDNNEQYLKKLMRKNKYVQAWLIKGKMI